MRYLKSRTGEINGPLKKNTHEADDNAHALA